MRQRFLPIPLVLFAAGCLLPTACSTKPATPTSTYDLVYELSDPSFPKDKLTAITSILQKRFEKEHVVVELSGNRLTLKVPYTPQLCKTYDELHSALNDFAASATL